MERRHPMYSLRSCIANTCFQEEKRNKLQNLFELELITNCKPTTQRDHLGLQILRKNETQTRPKRDPNETQTTPQTTPQTRTHPTPMAQLPTPQPKIPPHTPKPNGTTTAKMLHFRLKSYLTCEPM